MGEWTITRDGKDVRIGADPEAMLYALVMTEGNIDEEDLESVLDDRADPKTDRHRALKAALTTLRTDSRFGFKISREKDPVTMSHDQPNATIDLWEFFELAELKRYKKAAELIAAGQEPVTREKYADHNKLWKSTIEKFNSVKCEVMAEVNRGLGRNRLTRDTRQELLERSLVPGIGGEVPIRDVRDEIELIDLPWCSIKPDRGLLEEPLPPYLSDLLEDEAAPRRVVVVIGGHGTGKTLASIASYLRLTDQMEDADFEHESRPVIYVDGEIEGQNPDFGTDKWLDDHLKRFDAVGDGRRVVIMSHADAFFLRAERPLKEILGWRMFREGDVLLCCSEQFYLTKLKFVVNATHVIGLEWWESDTQLTYASARFGKKTSAAFKAWRDEDRTKMRAELLRVPLHVTYVLPIVDEQGEALERISTCWHLFDRLARVRLEAAGHELEGGDRFGELAAIAHRFYRPDMPAGSAIGFDSDELRDFLNLRSQENLDARLDVLLNNTLLIAPPLGGTEHRFETPAWGWFFAAWHLTRVLKLSDPPETVLKAFDKHFSPEVMSFCEEMLSEGLKSHEENILGALHFALFEDSETPLRPMQREIARSQIGYLLALLGDDAIRADLAEMLDPKSATAESEKLVQNGIERGLKGARARPSADALGHRGGV